MVQPRTLLSGLLMAAAVLFAGGCDFLPSDDKQPRDDSEPSEIDDTAVREMLDAVNAVRTDGTSCGNQRYPAAAALGWDDQLARSALRHSTDMATNEHFSHVGTDGSTVGDRVSATGYRWSSVGENIAYNYPSIEAVVAAWYSSPGHCANLMNPTFTEMGAADVDRYWTQNFARPR